MAGLGGPDFPPHTGGEKDKPYTDIEWTNGKIGNTYQNNKKGPWQVPNRKVTANWGLRAAAKADWLYYLRPPLLCAQGSWALIPGQPVQTTFHLRQTKYIDHPCDAIVIQTNNGQKQNEASHFPDEWLRKADGHAAPYGPGVFGHATAFINALIANLAPASFPDLSARAIPVNPQQYTVAAVGAVAYGAITAAAFGAGPIPAIASARNITFPLLGYKTYGFERATEQACRAMKEWFTPVAVPPSEAYAAGAAAGRRAGYDNVYLTIPNEENTANPRLPAPRTFNVYNKAMGAQENA